MKTTTYPKYSPPGENLSGAHFRFDQRPSNLHPKPAALSTPLICPSGSKSSLTNPTRCTFPFLLHFPFAFFPPFPDLDDLFQDYYFDETATPQTFSQPPSVPMEKAKPATHSDLRKRKASSLGPKNPQEKDRPLTDAQKTERRERNREHAKRSRLRKKFLLESLQEQINGLQVRAELWTAKLLPHQTLHQTLTQNPTTTGRERELEEHH